MSLVSIIVPVYNADRYLEMTIRSVIGQSYDDWELILINDGSTDRSDEIIKSFSDKRIRYFSKQNGGVSQARNMGLSTMKGEYFCFLDADDVFPVDALSSRIKKLNDNPDIDFVDGRVIYADEGLQPTGKIYQPAFRGIPTRKLLSLSEQCLFGNTWMIRKHPEVKYQFNEKLTHSEDLCFYLDILHQKAGVYDYVDEEILHYRRTAGSAMTNIKGLEQGYEGLLNYVKELELSTHRQYLGLKLRVTRIMFLSYLLDARDVRSAVRVLTKYIIQ